MLKFGEVDLDSHHANRGDGTTRNAYWIDRLRDKIAGLVSGVANPIEAPGITVDSFPEIWAKTEISVDEAERLVPIARCQRVAVAIHHVDRNDFRFALDRL